MHLNTDHLLNCIITLESSLQRLQAAEPNSIDYEVFRNATIKGFELTLETAGKLLRKALKFYISNPRAVDELTYNNILRYATRHGLLDNKSVERWFQYRNNRNTTAHDYGKAFVEETLKLILNFLNDARELQITLQKKLAPPNA